MNYSLREVANLLDCYMEYREKREDQHYLWARLIDLSVGMSLIPPILRETLFECGVRSLPYLEVAKATGVSSSTVHTRYRRGLEMLTSKMNGEEDEG